MIGEGWRRRVPQAAAVGREGEGSAAGWAGRVGRAVMRRQHRVGSCSLGARPEQSCGTLRRKALPQVCGGLALPVAGAVCAAGCETCLPRIPTHSLRRPETGSQQGWVNRLKLLNSTALRQKSHQPPVGQLNAAEDGWADGARSKGLAPSDTPTLVQSAEAPTKKKRGLPRRTPLAAAPLLQLAGLRFRCPESVLPHERESQHRHVLTPVAANDEVPAAAPGGAIRPECPRSTQR